MKSSELLADVVVYDKYARYLPNQNRRENWDEICDRVATFFKDTIQSKNLPSKDTRYLNKGVDIAIKAMRKKQVLPSMRITQYAGEPVKRNNARAYNCSFLHLNSITSFAEGLFLLLSGCGVGYSVQRHVISKLPERSAPTGKVVRIQVEDNIEGWADSLKILLSALLRGHKVEIDYSLIRPEGSPLKVSGGTAPGPDGLKASHANIIKLFEKVKVGEKLTSLQCHDIMCYAAEAVLSGGSRRSAMIALFDADDLEMTNCKSDKWWETNPQRRAANNSAITLRDVSFDYFSNLMKGSYSTGEPGVLWTNDLNTGTNPCFHPDAPVITRNGLSTIGEINVGDEIWDGKDWTTVTNKVSRGVKPVFKYHTTVGYFYGTDNHKVFQRGEKVEVGKATHIDVAIGNLNLSQSESLSAITSDDVEKLRDIQLLLSHKGKISVIEQIDYDTFILTIVQPGTNTYEDLLKNGAKIEAVESCGTSEVFDITVNNEDHSLYCGGLKVANCGEIRLKPFQFCNLVTINAGVIHNQKQMMQAVKSATTFATIQASLTDFTYLRDIWKQTTEEHALIGVSLTGVAHEAFNKNIDLKAASTKVYMVNEELSNLLKINRAKRFTTLKPEGTSSIVLQTSSGIGTWYAPYYIRRITLLKSSNLYSYLYSKVPNLIEDNKLKSTEAFLCMPIKAPDDAITKCGEGTLALLKRIMKFNREWIRNPLINLDESEDHNNVSATLHVHPEEELWLTKELYDTRDQYNGMTIFPFWPESGAQTPFQEITKEVYEEKIKELDEVYIDLRNVIEYQDNTKISEAAACAGGSCELI